MATPMHCPVHHCAPAGWYDNGEIHVQCIEESCRVPKAIGGDYAESSDRWNAICATYTVSRAILPLTASQLERLADVAEEHWREVAPEGDWPPIVAAARELVRR